MPKKWKESRVVLVDEDGSRNEVRNYRPIAIINVICKIYYKWMGGRECCAG